MQVQGDDLDRLAQTHVVGQAAAEPEFAHPGQPRHAAQLVGAQGGDQIGRRFQRRRGGGGGGDALREFGQRPLGDDRHLRPVDVGGAGEDRAQRLDGSHMCTRRAAHPFEQGRVDRHPPATQPHQRTLHFGERAHLFFGEQKPTQRELPAEPQQRVKVEPGGRDRGG